MSRNIITSNILVLFPYFWEFASKIYKMATYVKLTVSYPKYAILLIILDILKEPVEVKVELLLT